MSRIFRNDDELLAGRPYGGYRMVLADPPWREEMRSEKGEAKSPQAKYRCMTLEELRTFGHTVRCIAGADSACLMWTTAPLVAASLTILQAWGFTFKTMATWAKESKNSGDLCTDDEEHKFTFGTGYIFRSAAEFLLCGTRGEPAWKREPGSRSIRNLIYAPVREHSRKPDEQYAIAEGLSHAPFIELFSRTSRPGWDHFGDQAESFEAAA